MMREAYSPKSLFKSGFNIIYILNLCRRCLHNYKLLIFNVK